MSTCLLYPYSQHRFCNLSSSCTAAHLWFQSCEFCVKFLMPIIFISLSTESSHCIVGLPKCLVLCGLWMLASCMGLAPAFCRGVSTTSTFLLWSTLLFLALYSWLLLILWYLANRTLTLYFQTTRVRELQKELPEQEMMLAQEMDHILQEQMREAKLRWL